METKENLVIDLSYTLTYDRTPYLVEYGKFSLEASACELHNLLIISWLLATKLIAWECQNL